MIRHLRCTRSNASRPNYCGKRLAYRGVKPLDEIKCPNCGSSMMDVTKHVKKDRNNKGLCNCDGLYFIAKGSPHRKGSKWCIHYKGGYDDEDWEEFYSKK